MIRELGAQLKLTRDKDIVDILIVMIDRNGGDSFGAHRGQHTARPVPLAGHMQLHRHIHRLLQHRVHPDYALGQRLIAHYRSRLVLLATLQRYEQPIAVPFYKVRVLEAEVQVQIRLHYRRIVVIVVHYTTTASCDRTVIH